MSLITMVPSIRAPRSPTVMQKRFLLDFMSKHTLFANGRTPGVNARRRTKDLWESLTMSLNCMKGAQKDAGGWRKCWSDMRSNAKKAAQSNAAPKFIPTGGRAGSEDEDTEESVYTTGNNDYDTVLQIIGWESALDFGVPDDLANITRGNPGQDNSNMHDVENCQPIDLNASDAEVNSSIYLEATPSNSKKKAVLNINSNILNCVSRPIYSSNSQTNVAATHKQPSVLRLRRNSLPSGTTSTPELSRSTIRRVSLSSPAPPIEPAATVVDNGGRSASDLQVVLLELRNLTSAVTKLVESTNRSNELKAAKLALLRQCQRSSPEPSDLIPEQQATTSSPQHDNSADSEEASDVDVRELPPLSSGSSYSSASWLLGFNDNQIVGEDVMLPFGNVEDIDL